MAIVMGLDQHRAQITAEWIDTATGELSRGPRRAGRPLGRAAVRRAFRGELEVALEATTGWRFVVEELGAVGAGSSRRAGRDGRGARDQESRQERSRRRQASA